MLLPSLAVALALQTVPPPADGPVAGQAVPLTAPEDPDADIAFAFSDVESRMTVPVRLGGSEPYRFVVDTGAQRTVVSTQLARRLALPPGPAVRLTSMTGTTPAATALVPGLSVGAFTARAAIAAPVLDGAHLGAPGLLGIDALAGQRLTIDFDSGEMLVRPARRRSARVEPDEIVVTARSLAGQLIVTDAAFAGQRIRVVIDTGATISVGNSLFRDLVARRTTPQGRLRFYSVTGQSLDADYALIESVRLGGLRMTNLLVAFADVPPFARFGLDDRPALLLGMGALRAFRRVEIDFPNRRIRFLLERD